jgi:hypothetical protein
MLLFAHSICFASPRRELIIEIRNAVEPKRVQMILRREAFDARKPRMLNPPRKHKVADEIVAAYLHGDERHSHLKSDPGFLRQDLYRATLLDHRSQRVEQPSHVLTLTYEMRFQSDVAARMTLVPIGKASAAFGAAPECWKAF